MNATQFNSVSSSSGLLLLGTSKGRENSFWGKIWPKIKRNKLDKYPVEYQINDFKINHYDLFRLKSAEEI